jgi:hypothetical protein
MRKNYRFLTESVNRRLDPELISGQWSLLNSKQGRVHDFSTITYADVIAYVAAAMKGPEGKYTQKSIEAGERVKGHLGQILTNISFRYQGSVISDTHIKGYSDIDLLVISEDFYKIDREDIAKNLQYYSQYPILAKKLSNELYSPPYLGNIIRDLYSIRMSSERKLCATYNECNTTKPKSIKIKNLDLNREVDVVIACWHDNISSVLHDKGDYRGIGIFDKSLSSIGEPDFPFLNARLIQEKSAQTDGRLKKMIRFLKNCKEDSSNTIEVSSFDIYAMTYHIDINNYSNSTDAELIEVLYQQLLSLCTNRQKADNLVSVDGREYIFRNATEKIQHVQKLLNEVEGIRADILENKPISWR